MFAPAKYNKARAISPRSRAHILLLRARKRVEAEIFISPGLAGFSISSGARRAASRSGRLCAGAVSMKGISRGERNLDFGILFRE